MATKKKDPTKHRPPHRLTDHELAECQAHARDNHKQDYLSICEELEEFRAGERRVLAGRISELANEEVQKHKKARDEAETALAEVVAENESLTEQLARAQRELCDAAEAGSKPAAKKTAKKGGAK